MLPRFSGAYTFFTNSDDGVRLTVNGVQVINNWTNHGNTENSGVITLTAGVKYSVKMEYYEATGGAVAKLLWSSAQQAKEIIPSGRLFPASQSSCVASCSNKTCGSSNGCGGTCQFAVCNGLKGEYFSGTNFGALKLTRVDGNVAFDWGSGAPDPLVGSDNFSVHWTGRVTPLLP